MTLSYPASVLSRRALRLGLLLPVLGMAVLVSAKDFPWDDFKKRSIQSAVELDLQAIEQLQPKEDRVVLKAKELILSKMTVTFSGIARELTKERRELLDRWAIFRNYDPAYAERYEQEYLFFKGEHKYWIAVQKPVAPHLVKQIKEAKEVELYLLSGVGGLRVDGKWELLLLLQEFQLPP